MLFREVDGLDYFHKADSQLTSGALQIIFETLESIGALAEL